MISLFREKKTPLKYRFLETVFLSSQKLFPNSSTIKKIRLDNQEDAIKHFLDSLPPGTEAGKIIPIDRIENISRKDFLKNYVSKGIPVVFKGKMKDWPCSESWSIESLAEKYGDDEYQIVANYSVLSDEERKEYKIENESAGKFKFRDIVKRILNNETIYLRFFPLLENYPELIDDFDREWLRKMSPSIYGAFYHSFIGAKGKETHCHSGSTGFLSLMVKGKKKWKIWDTSYFPILKVPTESKGYYFSDISREEAQEKYPHFKYIDRYEFVLEEGDILYCPVWMFHSAHNLSNCISVRHGIFNPIDLLKSSFGLTFIKIFFSGTWQIIKDALVGKGHDRNKNIHVPKFVKK